MTTRRAFLAGTGAMILAAPLAAEAQQAGKVYRIGVLSDELPVSNIMHFREPFQKALRTLGYVEGQNIVIEDRSSEGRQDRLSGLAADLVRLKVEFMVTMGTPASRAAMDATKTIPIVFARVADPVGSGLVSSLGRPGGNTTGVTVVSTQLAAKRLALLKEAFPRLVPVGILWDPTFLPAAPDLREIENAARSLKVQVQPVAMQGPEALERAFNDEDGPCGRSPAGSKPAAL